MQDTFVQKQAMYSAVHTLLRKPENQSLWLDNPPVLTRRVAAFEAGASALGAFGAEQGQGTSGVTQEQNLAETALEDAAFRLASRWRIFLRENERGGDAVNWDFPLTDWRKMRENVLLDKARLLHDAISPAIQDNPVAVADYGLTAPALAALQDLIEDYDEVIGAPKAARGQRKAKTSALRPRFRQVDAILDDIDDLIVGLRGESAEHDLLVDAYFNARRIGGRSAPENAPAPPTG